jgi:hypothetical protein
MTYTNSTLFGRFDLVNVDADVMVWFAVMLAELDGGV